MGGGRQRCRWGEAHGSGLEGRHWVGGVTAEFPAQNLPALQVTPGSARKRERGKAWRKMSAAGGIDAAWPRLKRNLLGALP